MQAPEPAQSPQATTEDPRASNREKFELELEFVQSLANPYYLHNLAQRNILDQPAFINYLEYLTYWKEKDYARFIRFVHNLRAFTTLQPIPSSATHTHCTILTCSSTPDLGQK
jgi:mediator of RNA polymerase II transcription subunit 31